MDSRKSIVFFTRYTADAPVSRYRYYAQKDNLEKNGFRCVIYPFYSPTASRRWYNKGKKANRSSNLFASLKRLLQLLFMGVNEIAFIEYPLLPGTSYRLQKWLPRKQKQIVTDLIYTSPDNKIDVNEEAMFLSDSDIVITPDSGATKRVLAIAKEVIKIPPCVSAKEYTSISPAAIPEAEQNVFRIGWIGTGVTSRHLLSIKDCLRQLHDLYHIQLVLIGFDKKHEKELQGLPYTIYARDAGTEISLLKTCDVGILPLPDTHQRVETTSFPMIQYMACGLPVVASSNETTISVNHGNDNLFARTSFEWYSCLAAMIQNKAVYKEVGQKNQAFATDFYSVENTQKDYLSLVQKRVEKG